MPRQKAEIRNAPKSKHDKYISVHSGGYTGSFICVTCVNQTVQSSVFYCAK